jgi:hypothetical protein
MKGKNEKEKKKKEKDEHILIAPILGIT